MSHPQRDDAAATRAEPMIEVLERIHAELADIAARIDRNQATIAKSTWTVGSADADYVKAMQDADLSAQRIAGVADFLRALGNASQPHWRIDTLSATGALKLAELVRTIGASGATVDAKNEEDAGDVDLF